ncbi:MAG: D-Ala-D-Ala carboxypeptidase family metallohydrolase [Acidimicrobiia bacterium]
MAALTRRAHQLLNTNGFPCGPVDGVAGPKTKAATARFQTAYNGPRGWLAIDGIIGPKTAPCLEELPRLSGHFVVRELSCRHCGQAYVHRQLLVGLEVLRSALGRPLVVRSAYRCPDHNRAVGGAKASMHLHGMAADVAHPCTVADARAVRQFSGIGDDGHGLVAHLDRRHLLPEQNLTPDATPDNPARWHY